MTGWLRRAEQLATLLLAALLLPGTATGTRPYRDRRAHAWALVKGESS